MGPRITQPDEGHPPRRTPIPPIESTPCTTARTERCAGPHDSTKQQKEARESKEEGAKKDARSWNKRNKRTPQAEEERGQEQQVTHRRQERGDKRTPPKRSTTGKTTQKWQKSKAHSNSRQKRKGRRATTAQACAKGGSERGGTRIYPNR